jgi:GH18 family chitinase
MTSRPQETPRGTTHLRAGWALAVALILCSAPARAQQGARYKVVAYVPNWGDVAALAGGLDYGKLTHLNVAFENPMDDGGDLSFNPQDAALIARAHAHGVRVLVSLGGGAASEDAAMRRRYAALLAPARRAGFVATLARYVAAHGLDGLDLDLEGPAITGDYGAFVRALAQALRPRGRLLTAALSQGYGGDRVPASAFASLDWVNIMAYDATGDWSPQSPGQHSSLEFAQGSAAYWLARGLPRSKAVLGVPFYGYGFGAAFRARDYPYAEIVAAHPGAEHADQVGNTIWYNGMPTIRAKTEYVRAEGLAGVMIWSLDSDAPGGRSLLSVIAATLRPTPAPRKPGRRPPQRVPAQRVPAQRVPAQRVMRKATVGGRASVATVPGVKTNSSR